MGEDAKDLLVGDMALHYEDSPIAKRGQITPNVAFLIDFSRLDPYGEGECRAILRRGIGPDPPAHELNPVLAYG